MVPLNIESVSKSYAKRRVLNEISFNLNEGEIFGLVGLNGAGKTTLIKIILDLVTAEAGNVHLFGQSSTNIAAREKLSYLPEKFHPSRYLKGMEYLDLTLSYYKQKLNEEEAREYARKLDLAPSVLDARVGSYSKGMGQKLGLLGAFLSARPLMILDEPMSGLDPKARIRLKHMLLETKQRKQSVFFSSHILSDIDEICDRIGIIHDGRLCFIGTPQSFKEKHGSSQLEQAFLHLIEAA